MGGYAWVTLATNDSYSLGALVLAHSLKKSNTAHKLVVLITPAVSQPMREQLKTVFDLVKLVEVLDSKDEAHLALLKRPELGITFTKLHCWRLTEFDKCVFLDADTLVVKNCDELFEREELSAAPDVSWPDCFNSGVFVYKPSIETFDKILQFAVEKGSFDGGDQGLLNQYFSDWATEDIKKHLPFVYNLSSLAAYSYIPAFKQYGADTRIVHFIGTGKPWLHRLDPATRTITPMSGSEHLTPMLQQWWDLFCEKVHPGLDKNLDASNGMLQSEPVEACSNPIPVESNEPQKPCTLEPDTPYREKDDFRQYNLPYQPFDVKGSSGELLNVEFLKASVVPPPVVEEQTEQQRHFEVVEEKHTQEYVAEVLPVTVEESRNEVHVEERKAEIEVKEPEPPKDPFDYNSFFPDEKCVSDYLEKNVNVYQPFENHHESHNCEGSDNDNNQALPRFLTIPEDDKRQSGNNQLEEQHHPPPIEEQPVLKQPTPPRKATPEPVVNKPELKKSKSMPQLDVTKIGTTLKPSTWKSQPDVSMDTNRRFSMPKLKPILPKQNFHKTVPTSFSKVTLYTEFLMSADYQEPADLPSDREGFVESHILKNSLRKSKSDTNIKEKFGPLPYAEEVAKPKTPIKKPLRPLDNDLDIYDLRNCKRQMGNKPKPKKEEKKENHAFPALRHLKGKRSRDKKKKEGTGKDRKGAVKKSPKSKAGASTNGPKPQTNGHTNDVEEILKRLWNFSKNYLHYFGEVNSKSKWVPPDPGSEKRQAVGSDNSLASRWLLIAPKKRVIPPTPESKRVPLTIPSTTEDESTEPPTLGSQRSPSGIAGAIAQLNLESSEPSPALQEYLRRQNWETGNMDYMGKDSFDNIWAKICQTVEGKEQGTPTTTTGNETQEKPVDGVAPPAKPESVAKDNAQVPEVIETLPSEPSAGPVEQDDVIFSNENKQQGLMKIAEEEESSAKAPGAAAPGSQAPVPAEQKASFPGAMEEVKPQAGVTPSSEPQSVAASSPGVKPETAAPQTTPAVPQTTSTAPQPTAQQTAPATPQPAASQTTPAAPQPTAQQTTPAAPQPTAPQTAPVTPQPAASQTAPAAPQPAAQQTAPAAPEPAAQQTAPAAPEPAAQQTAPAAPQPAAQQTAPATPQPAAPQTPPVTTQPAAQQTAPVTPQPPALQTTPPTPEPAAPQTIPPTPQPTAPQTAPAAAQPAAPPTTPATPQPAALPTTPATPQPAAPQAIPATPQPAAPQAVPATPQPTASQAAPTTPQPSGPQTAPAAPQSPPQTTTAAPEPATPQTALASSPQPPAPQAAPAATPQSAPATTPQPPAPQAASQPAPPQATPAAAEVKPEPPTPQAVPPQPLTQQSDTAPVVIQAPLGKDAAGAANTITTVAIIKEAQSGTLITVPADKPIEPQPSTPTSSTALVAVDPNAVKLSDILQPKKEEPQAEVKSEPIPMPPVPEKTDEPGQKKTKSPVPTVESVQTVDASSQPENQSSNATDEGKQKKGVFTKLLEMVGVAPKEKKENEEEASKSVFYDVEGEPKPCEAVEAVETKPEIPEKTKGMPKPARNIKNKSPSPKLSIPSTEKVPDTALTMPTPPVVPEASKDRKNSGLLSVDDTILDTPPVPVASQEPSAMSEIKEIIGKAKAEVESRLQGVETAEEAKPTEEGAAELVKTMKLIAGESETKGKGGKQGKQAPKQKPKNEKPKEVEELKVTTPEEREKHKGEVASSKLSDQILKAIPPPRRKAISDSKSEASSSTGAIPKTTPLEAVPAEEKNVSILTEKPAEEQKSSQTKTGKPSSIPVPPPRNKGKPATLAPPKGKGKK